ncbi:hypothetical protein F5X68DRAFT_8916 [Plectosphaerella plurivora]|uniref:Uncharacterized protein n=1 Tax=Plectosphaerella plurivora TaxID=936078 RepID=A0A9P9ABR7_9PEZI|nr:hypothetical protein F5X68DRAFT_8916 [Plectosphaerella plurivora]
MCYCGLVNASARRSPSRPNLLAHLASDSTIGGYQGQAMVPLSRSAPRPTDSDRDISLGNSPNEHPNPKDGRLWPQSPIVFDLTAKGRRFTGKATSGSVAHSCQVTWPSRHCSLESDSCSGQTVWSGRARSPATRSRLRFGNPTGKVLTPGSQYGIEIIRHTDMEPGQPRHIPHQPLGVAVQAIRAALPNGSPGSHPRLCSM